MAGQATIPNHPILFTHLSGARRHKMMHRDLRHPTGNNKRMQSSRVHKSQLFGWALTSGK